MNNILDNERGRGNYKKINEKSCLIVAKKTFSSLLKTFMKYVG